VKFWISRTSYRSESLPPCEGSKKVRGLITHNGTAKSLDEAKDPKWGGHSWFWREGMINQRKTSSGVSCDSEEDLWQIEINSLEELMALIKEEGRIVVEDGEDIYGKGPQIEIYDGYRE
jgi:hypothetical protein